MSLGKEDEIRAAKMQEKLDQLTAERKLKKPGLSEYIEACYLGGGIIDHAIRAAAANTFYIHPSGASGPTLDFFCHADGRITPLHGE